MSEKIVQLNEEVIKGQLKELVRGSVEETLNELLEAEAEKLTQAARYERNEQRQGYRSGHYNRNLTTTSGDVTLKVPKLKGISFETAIIERYRRRESSVEEALIEMYLAGVSVRRVEDITEALWGSKVSPSTISELNKKAYVHIEDWRNRPLQGGRYPYVYVDGIYLRRNWGGEFENVAILVAIAVNEDGYREVLGAAEGMKEDKASWVSFFQWLLCRILDGDNIRAGINNNLGFSEADRVENIRRIAEVSKLFIQTGIITIAAFISPSNEIREMAASIIGKEDFLEIYVNTPIEECERRDVKGLYAKARRGEIKDFTGVSAPFEAPFHPALSLDTSVLTVEESVNRLLDLILPKVKIENI